MDVGLAMTARNHPDHPRPLPEVYREVVDEAVLGEELGFRSWWLAEHHFAEDQHNPSQFPLLAAAAARTSTIRLGTYVLLLPLHNPLRVAEDAATVDIISDGRLELVIGAGPMPNECAVFGVDPKANFARTYEALEVIEKCFTLDEFTHEGKHFSFTDVRLTTKPVQPGGPRIYIAALGPQSMVRAGERGYSLGSMVHSPLYPKYLEAQTEAGRVRGRDYRLLSGPLGVHVAPTREQAWDEAEAALWWWVEFYRRRGFPMPLPPVGELRHSPHAAIYGVPFAVGTPDDVLQTLSAYRDLPMDEMAVQFHHPGMAYEPVARSMRMFAAECLPEIASWHTEWDGSTEIHDLRAGH
ncbi:MAG TPA: LLM class flavin-dependent oxidoreductase [Actinomycetes bacterium]|nr:LLM class flavin-dependent oxidoreductase [Actinomycetes bacterium]